MIEIDIGAYAWKQLKEHIGLSPDLEYQTTLDVQGALEVLSVPQSRFVYANFEHIYFPEGVSVPKATVDAMIASKILQLDGNGETGAITSAGRSVLKHLNSALKPVVVARTPGRKYAEVFRPSCGS